MEDVILQHYHSDPSTGTRAAAEMAIRCWTEMAAALSEAKPRQLQVARLRQEEEESWISSEELHTDGSSDEDCAKGNSRFFHSYLPASQLTLPAQNCFSLGEKSARRGLPCTAPPAAASEPATQDAPHLTETTRRLTELGFKESSSATYTRAVGTTREDRLHDEMEEQEDIMLWRPKRGSLKLPHIDLSRLQLSQSADAPKTAPVPENYDESAAPCYESDTSKKSNTSFNEPEKCNCKHDSKIKVHCKTDVQCDQPDAMTKNFVVARSTKNLEESSTSLEEVQQKVDVHELKSDDGGT
ncbi:hypothetical protein FHG87_006414 [Trinorchestia longiramus]|nr:hypothetical protein FHG87_006414 [Trinorchestia longiramus]